MQQYIIIMKEPIRAVYVATESYKNQPWPLRSTELDFFIYSVTKNTTKEKSSSLVLREIVPAA